MIHVPLTMSWGSENRGRLGFLSRTSMCTNSQRTVLPLFHRCGLRRRERLDQGHTGGCRKSRASNLAQSPLLQAPQVSPRGGRSTHPQFQRPSQPQAWPEARPWQDMPDLLRIFHLTPQGSSSFRTRALVASQHRRGALT